jgi:glycosyltransferase involved in cell wall biosynthesis
VIPSRFEGWSPIASEAVQYGKAILMTDTGCAGQLLHHGESGYIVPPESAPALAKALQILIEDSSLRETLGRGARTAAQTLPTLAESLALHRMSWEAACRPRG